MPRLHLHLSRSAADQPHPSLEDKEGEAGGGGQQVYHPLSIVAVVLAALRRSLVVCGAGAHRSGGGGGPMSLGPADIGWPTDVRHVAHVTFDPFDGFLGLPVDLLPDVPPTAPSASASVFGVSATSMQCSYDHRGNSVPTILLLMQRHLYSQGGLEVEGIFRINAENGGDVYVREQLSKGIVPHDIDMHCLAGLIKAWFRELPTGVLDSITPDQMMQCNTEVDCTNVVERLPPMEAALLNWAINLMADVVEHETHNKMNERNIAMVFAPNMTQMADPLTALIHAVQVMNFLKTLIIKTLQERQEAVEDEFLQSSSEYSDKDESHSSNLGEVTAEGSDKKTIGFHYFDRAALGKFLFSTGHSLEENEDMFSQSSSANDAADAAADRLKSEYGSIRYAEGLIEKLNFMKGVRKLCAHPVFQLSKSMKKFRELDWEV